MTWRSGSNKCEGGDYGMLRMRRRLIMDDTSLNVMEINRGN
jgi:hypothetical protein